MLKFRTRKRTPNPDGHVCPMCGVTVVVGPDGRCRLGHMVGPPSHTPSQALPDEAPVTATGEDRAEEQVPAEAPETASVVAVHLEAEPSAHPYDDILAWDRDPEPSPAATAPADADFHADGDSDAPAGGEDLRSVLGELLAWDEPAPSALDVSAEELPPAAGM